MGSDNYPNIYCTELNEYAWDQSDKFIKIFVSLSAAGTLSESDVTTTFTNNSMKLSVQNLNDKDYSFTVNNLLLPIDGPKSYHKIKTNMIAIYIKKQKEGEQWSHLTVVEKRVKDMKDNELKSGLDTEEADASNPGDPTGSIMNIMKKMYQSGDPETKRMIAKAWTEGQEKTQNMNM